MGVGWGHFPPHQPLLLTFMVTQKPHFFFIAKIDCFHHELDNFNSILRLASDLVELEASITLGKWGSYCFLGVEFRILFTTNFERVLGVHPTSNFRVEFKIEGEGEEIKLISNLFNCHNPVLKLGILHLILFMLCFMFQFYCICIFVCVLSMFGRD